MVGRLISTLYLAVPELSFDNHLPEMAVICRNICEECHVYILLSCFCWNANCAPTWLFCLLKSCWCWLVAQLSVLSLCTEPQRTVYCAPLNMRQVCVRSASWWGLCSAFSTKFCRWSVLQGACGSGWAAREVDRPLRTKLTAPGNFYCLKELLLPQGTSTFPGKFYWPRELLLT